MAKEIQADKSTIGFATQLLRELAHSREPLSVTALADRTGATKSRVSRTMAALREHGWVKLTNGKRGYALAWTAIQVGQFASAQSPLMEAAMPHLIELAEISGERALVSIPANLDAIVIGSRAGDRAAESIRNGAILEFPESPTTQALYAFRSSKPADLPILVALRLEAAEGPFESIEQFNQRIEQIRQEGVAYSVDVKSNRIGSVACPVFGLGRRVVGAITVVMRSENFTTEKLQGLADQVRNAAQRIGQDLIQLETG